MGSSSQGDAARERAAEVFAEALSRREAGELVELGALGDRHPELAAELERLCASWKRLEVGMARLEDAPRDAGEGAGAGEGERAFFERLAARQPEAERYRRHGELARGGMGAVLEVYDRDLARVSAMKVADLDSGAGAARRRARMARFLREARVTGRLEHPGIVPVHELGVDRAGLPYFTMPLVRGHDLRAVFEWVREGREGWSRTRALGVLLKVCETLAYAHSRGVLHRDLKPANVMVGRFGEVHVMDWGLAKVLPSASNVAAPDSWTRLPRPDADEDSALRTRAGDVLGTPAYMPPEQAAGGSAEIDARADVYAIGAMLYHLLVGSAPYTDQPGSSSGQEVVGRVLDGPPTALAQLAPGAPPDLVAICERAMAREPEARYPTARALAHDLRAWLEGRVVSAYERGALAELRKWVRRNRAVAALLVALVVAVPLLASLATYAAATRDEVLAAERHALDARVEEALEEGYLELGEGDPERALALFGFALEEDPASVEARAGRALAWLRLERPESALDALDQAGPSAETAAGLAPLRADVLRALGRGGEAEAVAAAADDPRTSLAAYLAAARELARGHGGSEAGFERAVELLERAVRLSRSARPLYWFQLAHALGHAAHGAHAARGREVAEVLEELWPSEPRALHWAGFALTAEEDLARGVELLESAVRLRPESAVHRIGLASALRAAGELERAAGTLREVLDADPDELLALEHLAPILRSLGEHAEAVAVARELARRLPRRARMHRILASALRDAGAREEALASYEEALRLDPGDRTIRNAYAAFLAGNEDYDRALAVARALVREDPSDAAAHARLGRVLLDAGDEPAGRAALRAALRLDPLQPTANIGLGKLCERAGDRAAAREHYEAAIAGDPRTAVAHYDLGCVWLAERELAAAVDAFRAAVRLKPSVAEAHCNLGHALRFQARFDEALESLRRGHELGAARSDWRYPSERWIRDVELLAATDRRLAEVLADPELADPVERAELARHALDTARAPQALRLFTGALDERPEMAADPRYRLLVFAARAAARTAQAPETEEARRPELRAQALEWLERDRYELERGLAEERLEDGFVTGALAALEGEEDLAGLRTEVELAGLPAAEAERWRAYWTALGELRASLAGEEEG